MYLQSTYFIIDGWSRQYPHNSTLASGRAEHANFIFILISDISEPSSNLRQPLKEKRDQTIEKSNAKNFFQAATLPLKTSEIASTTTSMATAAATSVGEAFNHSASTAASTAASMASATNNSLGKTFETTTGTIGE